MREARAGWGVENNPYQLYHRGYVAVKGGAQDCPYTFMHDMVNGRYKLPWDATVQVRDGTPCEYHMAGNGPEAARRPKARDALSSRTIAVSRARSESGSRPGSTAKAAHTTARSTGSA